MKHGPEKKRESKGNGKGSRQSSSPRRNSLEKSDHCRKKPFRKGKAANMLRLFWKVILRKGMPVIAGMHLGVFFF